MANAKKSAKPVEAVVVEPVSEDKQEPRVKRRYRTSSIFWGFAFIFVGVLVLLDNLGVVKVNFANLWQLWPVFIIGAGVSMLSLRGWFSAVVSVVLALGFGALAYLVAVDNPYYSENRFFGEQRVTNSTVQADAADKALDLTLRTGATSLSISSSATQNGYTAELRSNRLKLEQASMEVRDGVRYVALETSSTSNWWMGMGVMHNRLAVNLTEKLPVSLHIDSGASSLSGDLSAIQLKALSVKTGASSVDLKFGAKQARQDVTLEAGASSVTLSIPNGVGVRVETDNGLSSTNFGDIAKISEGVYESTGFSASETQITIHAKLGVSSFDIGRY